MYEGDESAVGANASRSPAELPADPPTSFELVVADIAEEATDVLSIVLEQPSRFPLPAWTPGAHIDVVLEAGLERQYSLCGDPADECSWKIAVLREPASRGGSEWIHSQLSEGDSLRVRGPRNHFELVAASAYILIAGGIGITPIKVMAHELASRDAEWELVYGGRNRASMAFADELGRYGSPVTLWPEDESGLIDLDARIGEPRADTAVYCCGPASLIDAVESRCARWPAGALHVERFAPDERRLAGEHDDEQPFVVVLDQSGITLTVDPGQTILEAVRAAGVDCPSSCQEGTCGTCETWVLEGVPDHRDSVLSEIEREDGQTMMVCCSRSQTERLVLDL